MSLDLCNSCLRFPERKCGITVKFLPWVPTPKARREPSSVKPGRAVVAAAPSLLRAPPVSTVKSPAPVVERPRTVQREPEAEETAVVFKSAARSAGCYDFIRA